MLKLDVYCTDCDWNEDMIDDDLVGIECCPECKSKDIEYVLADQRPSAFIEALDKMSAEEIAKNSARIKIYANGLLKFV